MNNDPCLSCPLPDCDDTDKRCPLRRLALSYHHKRKSGELAQVTDAERSAATRMHKEWMLERFAQSAEGVRPYNSSGSAWRG